jgi:hypothetical protein
MAAAIGLAGCASTGFGGPPGSRRQVLGYAASRSDAIVQTMQKAEAYCRNRGGLQPQVLREETVYQGRLDERVGAAAEAFGRVATAMGNAQAGQAGAAVGSPTDYKTTVDFVCQ